MVSIPPQTRPDDAGSPRTPRCAGLAGVRSAIVLMLSLMRSVSVATTARRVARAGVSYQFTHDVIREVTASSSIANLAPSID